MKPNLEKTLNIAVSSRALFDLSDEHRIYEEKGLAAFSDHQRQNEGVAYKKGAAFPIVQALLALNQKMPAHDPLVEVVILSGQSPDTGIRIMNSVQHYGLPICRAAFTGGAPVSPYLGAFRTDLLLSKSERDVQEAIDLGVAAARMYDLPANYMPDSRTLNFALDGDAVLFSEESEAIYKTKGFDAFHENEKLLANTPLKLGPFGKLLMAICRAQKLVPGSIRTALVTARSAPAHERALKTLRSWSVNIDEAFFLGGIAKTQFLAAFRPHIFVDDQDIHLSPASLCVPCAHVPYPSGSPLNGLAPKKSVRQDQTRDAD